MGSRRADDDEMLMWTVVENVDATGVLTYEHHLNGVRLGQFLDRSKPIGDPARPYHAVRADYLEHTYDQLLQPVKTRADLDALARTAKGRGASLCRHLLDPGVARTLWDWRDRIGAIRVTSYEAVIPWELVRLRNPDTGEVDDRYLAEYGLVRWLPDVSRRAPDALHLDRWRYLAADFPHGSAVPVTGEVPFFDDLATTAGLDVERVDADPNHLFAVAEAGDVDVLHIACHGEANLRAVDSARLLITDRLRDGTVEPVYVDAVDLGAALAFDRTRAPLVYLTACEGGQASPSLTDWGGWPKAFIEAGAGAFVGTSWSVRSRPAFAFSQAFYGALLGGETLSDAATAGRQAAKAMGDVSWLAYKVYGDPFARRAP